MSTIATIKHRYVVETPQDDDHDVSTTAWNDSLVVDSEAPDGYVLVRDSTQPDGYGFAELVGGGGTGPEGPEGPAGADGADGADGAPGADGADGAPGAEGPEGPAGDTPPRTIGFVIDGGGVAITTGVKGDIEVPFACTITAVRMFADQSGSLVVDIWKDTYANFPPTGADSITASAKPTISAALKSQDTTLTGWTLAVAAGDVLRFNVDSAATIQRATISLTVTVP